MLLIQYTQHGYSAADYQKIFKNNSNVKLILKFYELANLLPHQGFGRPHKPRYTFQIIRTMLNAVNSRGLHKHNPIKGLFNYSYPVGSPDYAYLNVIGKMLFAGNDITPPRHVTTNNLTPPVIKKSSVEKCEQQLKTLIEDPAVRFILLKGDTRMGKKHSLLRMKAMLNFNLYEGVEKKLFLNCVAEFAGSIRDPDNRKNFIADLENEVGLIYNM